MSSIATLSSQEFNLLRTYIEKSCGIALGNEKAYLIDSRLSGLLAENACEGYEQLYHKAVNDPTNRLRDKIVDAMTTNETLWFRDVHPYAILREKLLPALEEQFRRGRRTPVRIWSAACSTGQEPYSLAMAMREYKRLGGRLECEQVQIVATDISSSALFVARNGAYDRLAVTRGLDEPTRDRYFKQVGNVWRLDDSIKKMVTFSRLNLQDSLVSMGTFDIIFLRYVAIYFSDEFNRQLFAKLEQTLAPGGHLVLGAVESVRGHSTAFETQTHAGGMFYRLQAARS